MTIQIDKANSIGCDTTFIIAEIGSNHNQNLQKAYETIDAAIEAGADAVKFQSININKLYFNPTEKEKALHKKIDFPEEWHYELQDYCKKRGIIFFSSPTYWEAIDILEEIDVPLYKLASAQVGTFPQLVERVAKTQKPTILSTGIVSYGELEQVVNTFHRNGNEQLAILHCNSIYPTPPEKVYLNRMNVYKEMFNLPVGFSDHTKDIFAPIAAVAKGAKVIEKHFTLNRNLPVPDASFSLEPKEFQRMVDGIRTVEKAVDFDTRSSIEDEEKEFKNAIRTRLVLKKAKKAGEKLAFEDFQFLRHDKGIDCIELNTILGRRCKKNLSKDEVLLEKHII
jgi:sialic acid synthase SpsE